MTLTLYNIVNLVINEKYKNAREKNAVYGQQSALSYVYDIRPNMVNRVENGQKQLTTVKYWQEKSKIVKKNGQKWSTKVNNVNNSQYGQKRSKMVKTHNPQSPNPLFNGIL